MKKKIRKLPFYMMKGAPLEEIKEQIKIRQELTGEHRENDHIINELDVLTLYLKWRELGHEIGETDYE